jgi:3-(3-hydroxy-phenyl)propionate hydroxylase
MREMPGSDQTPMKSEHAVVIVGAGPTGLMLAGELKLAGVDVVIVERRATQELDGARACGLHRRTLEELDQRGIVERFVALGQKHAVIPFPGTMLDAGDLPTRHNYTLGLFQDRIEGVLADWVLELGVPIYRGVEVTGFAQDDDGVDVSLNVARVGGRSLRARYLVGCDGGRSLVRKIAGIEFPGWEPSLSYLIFEAEMGQEPAFGVRHSERGVTAIGKLGEGPRVRGVVTEAQLVLGEAPALGDLRAALIAAYGTDFEVRDVSWLSRFTDAARQAASYRAGRVLIAGDAAHVHSPTGGQGLQIGVQDAVNLGWKLAQVVKGVSPIGLLDTYQAERHPVAARVIKHTLAITALSRGDERTNALREYMAGVMQMDAPRKAYVAMMSQLDIRYDFGERHALLGRRMPDLDVVIAGRATRVFRLLHAARPVLLTLGAGAGFDIAPWADRVVAVDATYDGAWELPVLGAVSAPTAVLIRPDGYVAWVGERSFAGLADALTIWFGPPA